MSRHKLQTRDQQYAAVVFKQVCDVYEAEKTHYPALAGQPEKIPRLKKYGSLSHQLPVLIRRVGLAQALMFVDAKAAPSPEEKERRLPAIHSQLLADVEKTLELSPGKLLEHSRNYELLDYMHLTQQVLDALLWYKRFAQSVLNVDASDAGDEVDASAGAGPAGGGSAS